MGFSDIASNTTTIKTISLNTFKQDIFTNVNRSTISDIITHKY